MQKFNDQYKTLTDSPENGQALVELLLVIIFCFIFGIEIHGSDE